MMDQSILATLISSLILFLVLLPLGYLVVLAIASIRTSTPIKTTDRLLLSRFVIAIPAHNEANVIAASVKHLQLMDYPADLFSIHVVADHCSDNTAATALQAGAVVHERNQGPRSGKGVALAWLFQRILVGDQYDAVLIFDADTRVDPGFLRSMDARLSQGNQVIQGNHVISNWEQGWFPALTWAMFLIDNRFQNLGRSNLGWSAKNMGDSICFCADVLGRLGWGEGLTEDYQLRQKLLLEGIRIAYEPAARGYGEAALTWSQAQAQRTRWLRGTRDASQQFAKRLILEAIKRRDWALLDGALQASFPSYSTLSLVSTMILFVHILVNWFIKPIFPGSLVGAWAAVVGTLFIYPLFGLALERAPLRAYLAILSGPFFILWRTWLAVKARFGSKPVTWIRTAHGGQK